MQKQVYGIGSKSVLFLIEQGYAPSDLADNRLRRHELTEIGIRHSLFVADIHARTIALTRSGPAELVLRQEGRLPWDSVSAHKGDPEIPVRTDAYFVLKQIARPDRRNHVHVFLGSRPINNGAQPNSREDRRISRLLRAGTPCPEISWHAGVHRSHGDADAIPRAASRQAYSFIAFDDFTLASVLSAANSIT